MHMQPGPAFVQVHQQPMGGIGLFTYVGDGERFPGPHFWHQFSVEGQSGGGANASIEGTFVAWRFDWRNSRTVFPWAMDGARGQDVRRVLVRSTQSVVTTAVKAGPRSTKPAQIKQQYTASVINPTCQRTVRKKAICQIRYLFHTALIRGGPIVWQDQPWANSAQVLFDPAQGGVPIVYGPLKPNGQVTAAGRVDLWRSRGDETQHAPFRNKMFAAEITFREFLSALRLIGARSLAVPPANIGEREMAALFGPTWNDPKGWLLLDVNVGQEVYDEDIHREAYIGGAVMQLDVRAMSH
jgi:hypothetical protein